MFCFVTDCCKTLYYNTLILEKGKSTQEKNVMLPYEMQFNALVSHAMQVKHEYKLNVGNH